MLPCGGTQKKRGEKRVQEGSGKGEEEAHQVEGGRYKRGGTKGGEAQEAGWGVHSEGEGCGKGKNGVAQGGNRGTVATPMCLLECGLVNDLWWCSKQAQRGFTALFLHAFRVPCLTTILDSRSLECELHPCSTSSAVLRVFRRSNYFGWLQVLDVLFSEILRPTNLDPRALHLVRNHVVLFLLAASSAAVHLVHPDVDVF